MPDRDSAIGLSIDAQIVSLVFVDGMPKTPAGKLQKFKLREMAAPIRHQPPGNPDHPG